MEPTLPIKSRYKFIILVTGLLLALSLSISFLNYNKSVDEAYKNLKQSSLTLSVDNIYSEIQKTIVQPTLIASMMANDTFLKNWILNEQHDPQIISNYLNSIKKKFGVMHTFLVMDDGLNYYTESGLLETISNENKKDRWYFEFRNNRKISEVNMDINYRLDNSMILFMNYKIFDPSRGYIGTTGVALKTVSINMLLKSFEQKYKFNVYFIDENGQSVLKGKDSSNLIDSFDAQMRQSFLKNELKLVTHQRGGKNYALNIKYIPELNLYLVVEANIDDFTEGVNRDFFLNLLISLGITALVVGLIVHIISKYNRRLEFDVYHDSLTTLYNRRHFIEHYEKNLDRLFDKNQSHAVISIDIDNFKSINDQYGHLIGDKVLQEIATILDENVRTSDIAARWGGEEFAVMLSYTTAKAALKVAEKLRQQIEISSTLHSYVAEGVSASFGVTIMSAEEPLDQVMHRADRALYQSKTKGKNQVVLGV